MKTRTETVIDVSDFDKLVQDTYKRPYSFQQQDGCKSRGHEYITVPDAEAGDFQNDTVPEIVNGPEMGVSFAAWLARDPKQRLTSSQYERNYDFDIRLWWQRNFYPSVGMIVNDLYAKGLLPAGQYTIDIDW